jgi:hypothetical protein
MVAERRGPSNEWPGVESFLDAARLQAVRGRWAPMSSGTDLPLFGVAGHRTDDVYAAGQAGVLHYDGDAWLPVDRFPNAAHGLRALWAGPGRQLVVGGDDGLTARLRAGRWRLEEARITRHRALVELIVAVHGPDSRHVFALTRMARRARGNVQRRPVGNHLLRWDGARWQPVFYTAGPFSFTLPSGIPWSLSLPFPARYVAQEHPMLEALWAASPDDLFAVGGEGCILHFDGARWARQQSPTRQTLRALSGTGRSDVYAVGDGGVIVRFDGSRWTRQPSPVRSDLLAVWARGPGALHAVGTAGVILHHDGSRWRLEESGVRSDLHGVWTSPEGVSYVVGDRGTILRSL